ncbi:MAG TPA: Ni/Fe hydrogenase subunit alpha [Solirubrobacterales bacterium]|nr:Ni/Fe hydrogenase subunit alpha [Solirubrobacterales bacterium]
MSAGADGERTIRTDYLARVEGEGSLYVRLRDGEVVDAKLKIFEPPRFFEAFLRGRSFDEVPDITARICGICPVAYQMSSCRAMEDALGVEVGGPLRDLRRLIYCGEWIESHGLHVFMLHAPDFLGYDSAIDMAKDHREVVQDGLQMKKAGNELIRVVGGREVHPINVRVGGFYRAPDKRELAPVREQLLRARELARAAVAWTGTLDFPDFERDVELVSLREPGEYPIDRGRLVSNRGLDIAPAEFEDHVVEEHVAHSNALHSRMRERGAYLAGPMARYELNFGELSPLARDAAREAGLDETSRNPFKSIVVRAVEILYALDEAVRLIDGYEVPDRPAEDVVPRAGVGHGWTEAPRGMLYHAYELDADGKIVTAKIVPPTSQNQKSIDEDLLGVVRQTISAGEEELRLRCEQAIRNYDPCISCATHFLRIDVEHV